MIHSAHEPSIHTLFIIVFLFIWRKYWFFNGISFGWCVFCCCCYCISSVLFFILLKNQFNRHAYTWDRSRCFRNLDPLIRFISFMKYEWGESVYQPVPSDPFSMYKHILTHHLLLYFTSLITTIVHSFQQQQWTLSPSLRLRVQNKNYLLSLLCRTSRSI